MTCIPNLVSYKWDKFIWWDGINLYDRIWIKVVALGLRETGREQTGLSVLSLLCCPFSFFLSFLNAILYTSFLQSKLEGVELLLCDLTPTLLQLLTMSPRRSSFACSLVIQFVVRNEKDYKCVLPPKSLREFNFGCLNKLDPV